MLPKKLQKKLDSRARDNRLRNLPGALQGIDFYSNDYLGFASSTSIRLAAARYEAQQPDAKCNGATGTPPDLG